MKLLFLFIMTVLAARSIAQQKQPFRKAGIISPTETEIKKELNNILSTYTTMPNTQATWSKIIVEAQNILYRYFRNGKLLGSKAEQAYFVKMGIETMTATDIANHKMILLAGIATVKPAEFTIIRVEKICTGD